MLLTDDEVQDLSKQRQHDTETQRRHAMQNEMVKVYNNILPAELEEMFAEGRRLKINPIRRSWDDFVTLGAHEMPPYMKPPKDDEAGHKKAEKIEGIAYGWHGAAHRIGRGQTMESLQQNLIWWLVGTAGAVAGAFPDERGQTPFLSIIDPRTFFAPAGYKPWEQTPLEDAMIIKRVPLGWLFRRYGHLEDKRVGVRLDAAFDIRQSKESMRERDNRLVEYIQFYSSEQWTIMATGGKFPVRFVHATQEDKDFPGICPLVEYSLYNPEGARPWFSDLLGIDASMGRVIAQNIEFNDSVMTGELFTTGIQGDTINRGPEGVNTLKTGPELGGATPAAFRLGPTTNINSDRLLETLNGLLRIESRNPESLQINRDADSGRAIEALQAGPVATMEKTIWQPVKDGHARLYTICAFTEVNVWPDEVREIGVDRMSKGNPGKRETGYLKYRGNDLRGYEHALRIEPGLGLASYQDKVEIMQRLPSKTMSRRTALERMPDIPEPEREMRLIELDELRELDFASFSGLAAQGQLNPGAISEIIERVEAGESRTAVIAAMAREGRLLVPPPPDPMAGAMGGGGGGMPPDIAALGGAMFGGATNPEALPLSPIGGP